MSVGPDELDGRLTDAIDAGLMTDEEAREEWLAAEEEALEATRDEWLR